MNQLSPSKSFLLPLSFRLPGTVRRVWRAEAGQRQLRPQRRLLGHRGGRLQADRRRPESLQAVQRSPTRREIHGHQVRRQSGNVTLRPFGWPLANQLRRNEGGASEPHP